jgi:hypothetical protein
MGNPVGRTNTTFCNFCKSEDAYILGLWCADGYHRTSSIGLTSVDKELIGFFRSFLKKGFPENRIKMRTYSSDGSTGYQIKKAKRFAYQIYVNSRPLLRLFQDARKNPRKYLSQKNFPSYFAGRFDGDGSVAKDGKSDLRIAYGDKKEADMDAKFLKEINFSPSVYHYRSAKTYVIYISRLEAYKFLNLIKPYRLRYKK